MILSYFSRPFIWSYYVRGFINNNTIPDWSHSMKVAIHQPNYLPWIGYIEKIASVDVFVFLDDVQYSNQGGHNRNLIKTSEGKKYLTVPVEKHWVDKINEVRTKDETDWKKHHLDIIQRNYQKAPYFNHIYPVLEELFHPSYKNIAEMNSTILCKWSQMLGLKTEFKFSSEYQLSSTRENRILDICTILGADIYISGNGARAYQNENNFQSRGILLTYQNYKPIVYPQLWGDFIENLSALDYFMNCGFTNPFLEKDLL